MGGVQRHRRVTGCPHADEGGYCMDSTGAAGIRYQREGDGEGDRSWPWGNMAAAVLVASSLKAVAAKQTAMRWSPAVWSGTVLAARDRGS